nr:MAG TPA: hypothetical protein [Caudoviricetes sp.]
MNILVVNRRPEQLIGIGILCVTRFPPVKRAY